MKIDRIVSPGSINTEKLQRRDGNKVNVPTEDDLAVSDFGKLLQQVAESVKKSPDVRSEKVDALKQSIEAEEYRVDAKAVAGKMLENTIKTQA